MKLHFSMRKLMSALAAFYLLSFVLPIIAIRATAQDAKPNFVGTWQMTMAGRRGGRRGGGFGGYGGGEQSLTIAQNGDAFKVTHHTRRGDDTYDATVSGNSISWTEERQGRGGNTMKIDFKATLDGDSMTGTMGAGQFTRQFTAKRSN